MKGSIYVEGSKNSKVGDVDSTYSAIKQTCPDTCSLKGVGCYAQGSYVGMTNHRMERRARQSSPLQVARAEAKAIDQAYRGGQVPTGRALRLHVSGDSRTVKGTRVINAAIARWKARGGKVAWSYTHAWSHVPRHEWSNVSVLASIDKIEEATHARKQGYAPALVVAEFPTDKVYQLPGSEIKWIPCVNQTRGITCEECALCFNADRLYQGGFGIAFAAHGVKRTEVRRHLTVVK